MENYNVINRHDHVEKSQKSRPPTTSMASHLFPRSFSVHSPTKTEITKMPLLQSFERNGSIKKSSPTTSFRGTVKKFCSIFDKKSSNSLKTRSQEPLPLSSLSVTETAPDPSLSSPFEWIYLAGTEDRVVIYFTSLRGIRRTFLDCSYVLMILRAFRIELDERDVSMHIAYRNELSNVLGEKCTLPQVFIKGKHIGGAEMFRQLHETGELAKMLRGIPIRTTMKACEECGDIRFVPCRDCSGSKKVFDEDEDKVVICPDCNENGLIHCQFCNVGF